MRRLHLVALVVVWALAGPADGSAAEPPPLLIPPVDAPVGRAFEAPPSAYGPGHRGVDYPVPAATAVRAAAGGLVAFAGAVASSRAVTIEHDGGLATTYSILDRIDVARGEVVAQGQWIGTTAAAHPGEGGGLHFGVKLDGNYVDPLAFLGPVDVARALHLAPLDATEGGCLDPVASATHRPPTPNDNVAVTVGGIGTGTAGGRGAPLGPLAGALGFAPGRIYHFSYRGLRGDRGHEPYRAADTLGDLVAAARRLRALLEHVARRHPRASVDLIAHSQGGIVARVAVDLLSESWDPALPRVQHVVTFATPHRGTPLAAVPGALRGTALGRVVLRVLSDAARRGWVPIPPPDAPVVAQLAPGSSVVEALAREDVAYGTRLLSLVMAHDIIVPADRAHVAFEPSRVVAPAGAWGHSSILASARARSLAYAFLRDAGPGCPSPWDEVAHVLGGAVGLGHAALGWVVRGGTAGLPAGSWDARAPSAGGDGRVTEGAQVP